MDKAKIIGKPKRTCEESLAYRATISPPDLRRKLPKPALAPTVGPSPAAMLRELMTYPFPEPVWQRMAQQALDDGEPHEIVEAIGKLSQRIAEHQKGQAKLQKLLPNIYPKAA